jgi:signal peptidase I
VAAAAPTEAVTAAPPVTANGEVRLPAAAPAAPGGLRALGKTAWELVWPPTGAHVAQADSIREVVETVVFVVVLVLLLKSFAAEAFVIPTGSMAETLWGYQRVVECPKCHYVFPVNCSSEVDPQEGHKAELTECTCPNCRYHVDLHKYGDEFHWNSGDRVLVAKSLYELGLIPPERRDVVVFKFPGDESFPSRGPQLNHVPMNYIKRLIGLGGETIGIWYGKLYRMNGDRPEPEELDPQKRLELWKHHYMHEDKFARLLETGDPAQFKKFLEDRARDGDERARRTLEEYDAMLAQGAGVGRFEILQKSADKILALKRLVYDNDHPAVDLAELPRWLAESGAWAADKDNGFHAEARGQAVGWLHYRHLLRGAGDKPQLITDFMGYNAFDSMEPTGGGHRAPPQNWVGDLILECEVTVEKPAGEVVLELSKGPDRFRARWDVAAGKCTLLRVTDGKETPLGESRPSALRPGVAHRLRFANVDDRLTVWVDGSLPFREGLNDGVNYTPAAQHGPTRENDLQPASIGTSGVGISVRHLKLGRDTYYTLSPGGNSSDSGLSGDDWSDPTRWEALRHLPARTLFVQPGHYLCLGDNSPESSDGRSWGTVPERLLLGRALLVYYPFKCPIPPLSSPVNRVGPIR